MSTIPDLPEAYGADRSPAPPGWDGAPAVTGAGMDACASLVIPAGTYWFGDPGLALTHERWDTYLGVLGDTAPHQVCVIAFESLLGAGTYLDARGGAVHTDSGLIGLVDARNLALLDPAEQAAVPSLGTFLDFPSPSTAHARAGLLTFGDHSVDTSEANALGPRCRCGALLIPRSKRSPERRIREQVYAAAAGQACDPCRERAHEPCCDGFMGQATPRTRPAPRATASGLDLLWSSLSGH